MTNPTKAAEEWARKHTWDIPTRGAMEREESCKLAFLAGYSQSLADFLEFARGMRCDSEEYKGFVMLSDLEEFGKGQGE